MLIYPRISIIILNWNGWKDTIECLESLYRVDYPNYEVILIDNFSTDNSVKMIKSWINWKVEVESEFFKKTKCTHELSLYEYTKNDIYNWKYLQWKLEFDNLPSAKKLFLIKNDDNYWFAWWCNIGIKQVITESMSDYIFLLNNDTVIDKSYFTELFDQINLTDSHKIWCIGWKIYNYYTNDFWINTYKNYPEISKVWNLTWAGLLISLDSLRDKWLFDEYLFLYCEDYDLTYRISYDYDNFYINTKSKIYHKAEASSSKMLERKLKLQIRNQFILYKRHKKYYPTKEFIRTLLIFLNNNRKINFWLSIKAFLIGIILWIVELLKNKWPIW